MASAPHPTLVVGAPGPLTGLVMHAWLDAGQPIVAFLHATPPRGWREDRLLAWLRPRLSATAALRRAGLEAEEAPRGRTTAAILAALDRSGATLLLSAGFGRRIRPEVLARLPGRAVNLHPALLPAYRGPAPSLAMLRDDAYASAGGATLHLMDEGFDTGPLIAQRRLAAPAPTDALGYRVASAVAAAALAAEALPAYLDGRIVPTPQPAEGGPEARASPADFLVGPEWDAARIRRLAAALPWTDRLLLPGPDGRAVPVAGRPRFLPAGAPPAPFGHLQAPCAEGIVRFRRWGVWDKRWWRARRLLRQALLPLPPPGPEGGG
ncbi:MAG: formyltransferase family protein [Elioraea tepidiphila]